MKYGINVKYLAKNTSFAEAVSAVKNAGFEVLDYTPDLKSDDWEKKMNCDFEEISAHGLTVHQTHAPFNRYGSWDGIFTDCLGRALDATIALGAKYMVVHGDEFDFENLEYTPKNALEYNYRLYFPYVEKAAANGVKIAFENVFEDIPNKPRFCSKADDLKALIEKFDTDAVCCCFDTGHAGVSFKSKLPQKILLLGEHIECTHIHDCGHAQDLHLPPFFGDIDWDACMKAFAQIGYKGNFTYEMVYGAIPQNMVCDFAGYLKKTADTLIAKFN